MLKFFLASHGHFASGMKNSTDILLGGSPNLTVFDAYVDESLLKEQLDSFFKTVTKEDQIILLSDLYGGSVNQIMSLYLDKSGTMLIAGVNLALVLELLCQDTITEKQVEELVTQSREMLRIVSLTSDTVDNSDFF